MKYPNRIQAAVLLDEPFSGLDSVARDFARIAQMKSGATFKTPEHTPGSFVRLFGGGEDLMLTFEYVPKPPVAEVFANALGSAVTGILCPDMDQRVARASSHILLEVSHGALGGVSDDPKISAMLDEIGVSQAWSTQEHFDKRLETLALMVRIATDHITPSAIHWTQSNQLITPETFEAMAATAGSAASSIEFPGPLTIHPILFGEAAAAGAPAKVGVRSFGARHWLGREILVPATALPWAAAYQTILTFCRIATIPNGYVIPDGDTFGHEGDDTTGEGGEVWRVHHRDAAQDGSALDSVPIYELVPLRHDACGFVSDDYVNQTRITKSRAAAALSEADQDQSDPESALAPADARIIAEKRRMAKAIGGHIEWQAVPVSPRATPGANARAGGDAALSPDPASATPALTDPQGPASSASQSSANAGAAPPQPATPSNPGTRNVSGRSLRAKVFGTRE